MACGVAKPNLLGSVLAAVVLLLLSPVIIWYSRRRERNLAKDHYQTIDESALRVAPRQFAAIAEQARAAGLSPAGCYSQIPGTGTGREELQMWLSPDRDTLAVARAERVWPLPVVLDVKLISRFDGGRRIATVGGLVMVGDASGLEDAQLVGPHMPLGQMLTRHALRLGECTEPARPFDRRNPLRDYEELHWQRVQKLAELGHAKIIDPITTQWRYTSLGERNLGCQGYEPT